MELLKKKILIVAGEFPYPANHGGIVDIWKRMNAFKKMNFSIDLMVTVKENPSREQIREVERVVQNIFIVKRSNKVSYIFKKLPLQINSRKTLEKFQMNNKIYDWVILEGECTLAILSNKSLKYKKIILRMHNDESKYFRELSKSSQTWFKKFYYLSESYKFSWGEPYFIQQIENIMFISLDEKQRYTSKYNIKNACFLPPAIDLKFYSRPLNNKTVLFIGSLFMINNQEAIRYYIKYIHPQLNDIKNYKFIIAGNNRNESLDWLYDLKSQFSNIYIYESPKDLSEIYEMSTVFVNPMLHGAGVKVKTIEAIVNGLPVISTTVGCEGTGLMHQRHILISDDCDEYAKYIRNVLEDIAIRNNLVQKSQLYIQENYNQINILKKFMAELL